MNETENCKELNTSLGEVCTKYLYYLEEEKMKQPMPWVSDNFSKLFRGVLKSSLGDLLFGPRPIVLKNYATMTAVRCYD